MAGLVAYGTYLPYNRLERSAIGAALGSPGGKGTRTVASFDEDATTMGVEAARAALAVGARRRRAGGGVLRHRQPAVSRQDQRHRGARRPRPARQRAGRRHGWRRAIGHRGASGRRPTPAVPRSAVLLTSATACRVGATSARAATAPPPSVRRRGRDRRADRRGVGHRGVPRALAPPGRSGVAPVGGAIRGGHLRRPGRAGVHRRPQGRRRHRRRRRPRRHHRPAPEGRPAASEGPGRADRCPGRRPDHRDRSHRHGSSRDPAGRRPRPG